MKNLKKYFSELDSICPICQRYLEDKYGNDSCTNGCPDDEEIIEWLLEEAPLLTDSDKRQLKRIEEFYHCTITGVIKIKTYKPANIECYLKLFINNNLINIKENIITPSFIEDFEGLEVDKEYTREELGLDKNDIC